MPTPSTPPSAAANPWGAASKFGFDDPSQWHTVSSVPLLDEHELTSDAGKPIATVDRGVLEEIARNNNRKVYETGDPATLILGHTSDDPRAPEKPAVGFVVNYRVKPFKRDDSGRVIYAIHGDYKLRPNKKHLIEEYPRRSVELWWSKRDIDPIAMLGGSSPERDLGAVIRNGRLNHVALGGARTGARNRAPDHSTEVIRFHSRGQWVIEDYAIAPATPTRPTTRGTAMPTPSRNGRGGPARYNAGCGPKGKMQYDDMGDEGLDTHDPGDDGIPPEEQDDGGGDWHGTPDDPGAEADAGDDAQMSPAVREVLQSKQFKDMQSKLDQLFDAIMGGGPGSGGEPGGMPGGGDDMGGMGEMPAPGGGMGAEPPPGPGAPPMGGGGGAPPPPSEEDSRRGMGQRPVQMSADSAFPGQGDTSIPDFGKRPASRMSRRGETMNGTARRGAGSDRTAQLEREVVELRRYARESRLSESEAEAARRVEALANEGYLFGNTPSEHAQGLEETKVYFSALLFNAPRKADGVADVEHEEKIIRARYQRRRPDPAQLTRPGLPRVSQYSRNPAHGAQPADPIGADGENFEPTDEEAAEYADLVTGTNTPGRKKYSRREAAEILVRRRRQ